MPYLDERAMTNLKNYKYASALSGFIDSVIMTPFWNYTVNLLPTWLAPNLITTISLLHGFLAYVLIMWYSPDLESPCPRWVYLVAAVCMFIYQTLDAIDGKQARRTKSSSPLGQLFDHGCDAICACLSSIFVAATIRSGATPFSFLVLLIHIIPFYFANWEESQTGKMRFGIIGVTEGQLVIMAVMLATGILGPDIWEYKIYGDYQLRYAIAVFAAAPIMWQMYESIVIVRDYYRSPQGHQFNASTAAWQLGQYLSFLGLSSAYVLAPTGLLKSHPQTVLLTCGMLFGYQVSRLIVAHVTDTPHAKILLILWPFPLVVANAWFSIVDPATVAIGYAIFVAVLYAHFVVNVVHEICSSLRISCFTIQPIPQLDKTD